MEQYLLERLTREIKISALNILRENAEISFLDKIAQSSLAKRLIFYGGTSLRLAYHSPRFSDDLDFLMVKKITENELKNVIELLILEEKNFSLKDIKEKRKTLFALLNLSHSSLKHPLNIKIEISKRKNGVKGEYLPLASSCSHLSPIILTATIESMKKLKEKAIKGRTDSKDWFDLWYISKYLKQPFVPPIKFPFQPKEFKRELKRFLPQNRWLLIDQIYV